MSEVVIEPFSKETFLSASNRMEIDVPRDKLLSRAQLVVEFDVTTTGASLTGALSPMGASAAIKRVNLRGNGDENLIDGQVSGYMLRARSYRRIGKFPHQSGLAAVMPSSAGVQRARVILPFDFINKRSVTPMATVLDPERFGQLVAEIEFQSDAKWLYPNFAGTNPTIAIDNVEIVGYVEQITNPDPSRHALFETKFTKMADLKVLGAAPDEEKLWPTNITLETFYMNAINQVVVGYPVPVNGVITDHRLSIGSTVFRHWNVADQRDILEQELDEITVFPDGLILVESSVLDFDIRDALSIAETSRTRSLLTVVKPSNKTDVEFYYESLRKIVPKAPQVAVGAIANNS